VLFAFAGVHPSEPGTAAQRPGQARAGGEEGEQIGIPVAFQQLAVDELGPLRRGERRHHPLLRARGRAAADPDPQRAQHEPAERGRLPHQHLHGEHGKAGRARLRADLDRWSFPAPGGQRADAGDVRQRVPDAREPLHHAGVQLGQQHAQPQRPHQLAAGAVQHLRLQEGRQVQGGGQDRGGAAQGQVRRQAPTVQRADHQIGARRYRHALTVVERRVGAVQEATPPAVFEDDGENP
jgi:hypothetical protein